MSEVTPQRAAPKRPHGTAHISGLDQTPLDDLFPTSPTTEQFFQVSNTLSNSTFPTDQRAAPRSHSSTGQRSSVADEAALQMQNSLVSPTSSQQSYHHSSQTVPPHYLHGRHPSAAGTNAAYLRVDRNHSASISSRSQSQGHSPSAHTHLSPLAGLSSEAAYSELSEHTTPSFDDDFGGADFGLMPSLGDEDNANLHDSIPPTEANHQSESQVLAPRSHTSSHRTHLSQGTATTSSYLLSPVDTNTPSPPTKDPLNEMLYQPRDPPPSVGMSAASFPTSGAPLQQTPALTGSSRTSSGGSSNNAASMPPHSQITSPVVTVENYSKGEPTSHDVHTHSNLSKRARGPGRSSTHLSPNIDAEEFSSEDEDPNRLDSTLQSQGRSARRGEDGSWLPDLVTGQAGINPESRLQLNEGTIPNLKDQEEHRRVLEKNADVENWLVGSAASSVVGEDLTSRDVFGPSRTVPRSTTTRRRRRAKSTGDVNRPDPDPLRLDVAGNDQVRDNIPGPGVLIDQDTSESGSTASSYESSSPASLRAVDQVQEPPGSYFAAAHDEEPSPRQFVTRRPWADPRWDSEAEEAQYQPVTSNAAMMLFRQRAESIETASRAATWGTRRLSETDIDKVIGPDGLLKQLSFGSSKEKSKDRSERKKSFLDIDQLRRVIPKRSPSNLKRNRGGTIGQESSPTPVEGARKESITNAPSPRRMPSFSKRSKAPLPNTGSAVAAMAGQIAAIGSSGSVSATTTTTPGSPWAQARNTIKRNRSRSDITRNQTSPGANHPGLSELMARSGGPPMPTLASPPQGQGPGQGQGQGPTETTPLADTEEIDEAEEGTPMEETGVTMDLKIQAGPIIPNYVGFQAHVRQLNSRLDPFLVDRISLEQVRRYKKLVDFKVKHLAAVRANRCSSKDFCYALGGQEKILPSRGPNKESDTFQTPFNVSTVVPSDEETAGLAEGAVAAAQFPDGVPLPPVKRLPAEFECPLCFQVKKFQKPSDWTKHVHEDVQPFTCTFPNCLEPKSFKRKADWVRHENERHRQLEWWTCNLPDCNHTCFRKDNFVQHLVREHKKREPRVKTSKAAMKSRAGSVGLVENWHAGHPDLDEPSQQDIDEVWALVEECHHETKKRPRDEPCKFCKNVCNSWKKLTVHLAHHMEQISLPVLEIVKQKAVTADTIVSPVERRLPQEPSASPPSVEVPQKMDAYNPMPYQDIQMMSHAQPDSMNYGFTPLYEQSQMVAPGGPLVQQQPGAYMGQIHHQGQMAAQSRGIGDETHPPRFINYQGPPQQRSFVPANNEGNMVYGNLEADPAYQGCERITPPPPNSHPTSYPTTTASMASGYHTQGGFNAPKEGGSFGYAGDTGAIPDAEMGYPYVDHVNDPYGQGPEQAPSSYMDPGYSNWSY
ncbi:MAG: hypothetical protein M4579_000712 [Chaenotheca gracillima]|nr:MAG: hypothetical protein M4579_000712 [Chaenotheca gracillima]